MTLLLMRHGKSDWDADADDHERPLNQRGERAAAVMGRLLTTIGVAPDRVISSSAVRARTTARLAAEAGEWDLEVELDRSLYLPAPETVIAVAERSLTEGGRVMVVGHQPAWGEVVTRLTGARVAMKTATVAILDRTHGGYQLEALLQPRHFAGG